MSTTTLTIDDPHYPARCIQMSPPPAALYVQANDFDDLMARKRVAIVGSRRMSAYGKQVTQLFANQLAGQGIVIISGLALGVDATAHQAALDAGGLTLAVLPSPVDQPLPSSNIRLAQRIVEKGGGLISTYPSGSEAFKGNFVARNELVAALSDIVLVTEAGEHSGTWHTAEFARQLSVPVMAVPTNITNSSGAGSNKLAATDWAKVAVSVKAVLQELGLASSAKPSIPRGGSPAEQTLLDLMASGIDDGNQLLIMSQLTVPLYNQALSMLEISGKITAFGANRWSISH